MQERATAEGRMISAGKDSVHKQIDEGTVDCKSVRTHRTLTLPIVDSIIMIIVWIPSDHRTPHSATLYE